MTQAQSDVIARLGRYCAIPEHQLAQRPGQILNDGKTLRLDFADLRKRPSERGRAVSCIVYVDGTIHGARMEEAHTYMLDREYSESQERA